MNTFSEAIALLQEPNSSVPITIGILAVFGLILSVVSLAATLTAKDKQRHKAPRNTLLGDEELPFIRNRIAEVHSIVSAMHDSFKLMLEETKKMRGQTEDFIGRTKTPIKEMYKTAERNEKKLEIVVDRTNFTLTHSRKSLNTIEQRMTAMESHLAKLAGFIEAHDYFSAQEKEPESEPTTYMTPIACAKDIISFAKSYKQDLQNLSEASPPIDEVEARLRDSIIESCDATAECVHAYIREVREGKWIPSYNRDFLDLPKEDTSAQDQAVIAAVNEIYEKKKPPGATEFHVDLAKTEQQ